MARLRLIFSGSGGQGVITAAIILAESAVMHEDLVAIQSQSYGPEARGGATRAEVIISDTDIRFPRVNQPNILVCLTQESYAKYYNIIRPGGILITDTRFVKTYRKVDSVQRELPMYRIVMDEIGNPIVFNICMLGAVLGITGAVAPESVIKTLKTRIPESFLSMNQKALELGIKLGEPYRIKK